MFPDLRQQFAFGAGLMLAGAVGITAGALVWAAGAAPRPPAGLEDLIRFHVYAHSDSPQDQAVKLKVRDALLPDLAAAVQSAANPDAAILSLSAALPRLQTVAQRAAGSDPVAIRLAPAEYDGRLYGDQYIPPGRYMSLQVTIGLGRGRNWWCVLYPAVCFGELYSRVQVQGEAMNAAADGLMLLLDERPTSDLPVQADSALLRWLRSRPAA